MPKRVRNYANEYARRKERAIREGYKGYHQKRTTRVHIKAMVQHFSDRIDTSGYNLESWDWDEMSEADPEYWIWFRVNYGEGTAT